MNRFINKDLEELKDFEEIRLSTWTQIRHSKTKNQSPPNRPGGYRPETNRRDNGRYERGNGGNTQGSYPEMPETCGHPCPSRRGTMRPVSYILMSRNDGPDDIREESRSNRERHDCQTCWGKAHCWCPDDSRRTGPPDDIQYPRHFRSRSRSNLKRWDICDWNRRQTGEEEGVAMKEKSTPMRIIPS